jgi:hypothetical protein
MACKYASLKHALGTVLRPTLFFALFFLIIYFWIDTKLIYHGHGSYLSYKIYLPASGSFADFPPYPGKTAEYLAAALARYFYYSWAGALIITVTAWLIYLGADRVTKAFNFQKARPLRFLPPILILILYAGYHNYLQDCLALVISLLFFYIYTRLPSKNKSRNAALFLLFSALTYSLALPAWLNFISLCLILELFKRQKSLLPLLILIAALSTPFLANFFIYNLSLRDAYTTTFYFDPRADLSTIILRFALIFSPSVLALCCILLPFLADRLKAKIAAFTSLQRYFGNYQKSNLRWPLETLFLLVITTSACFYTTNLFARRYLLINYFASRKMWQQLLVEAQKLPLHQYSHFICHDVNRALFHIDRLPYDMFAFPQHIAGFFLQTEKTSEADILYELGHINRAEDASFAELVKADYCPTALKRLALINIVKRQPDAAGTFLNALKKDSLYRKWTDDYLQRLEKDPLLTDDPEIQYARSVMMTEDNLRRKTAATDDFYLMLLNRNRANKMAFEYLMARYMLTGQLEKFIKNVNRLDDFDYPRIPRHYAEAALLYTALTGRVIDLKNRKMADRTIQRFADFMARTTRYNKNSVPLQQQMALTYNNFGDTYYYYYYYLLPRPESGK